MYAIMRYPLPTAPPPSSRTAPRTKNACLLFVALPHPVSDSRRVVSSVRLAEDVERVGHELGVFVEEIVEKPEAVPRSDARRARGRTKNKKRTPSENASSKQKTGIYLCIYIHTWRYKIYYTQKYTAR